MENAARKGSGTGGASEIEQTLSTVPYFRGLSPLVLRNLAASSRIQRLLAGESLSGGDELERLWFVRSGAVLSSISLPTGKSVDIDLSLPGDGLDEVGLFGEALPPAEARALVDSVVI